MSKVTKKDIHNPCSVNNSGNIKLLLAVIGVVMCIIGGTVCFWGNDKGDEEADAAKTAVVIKTKEDADKYLRENSNYSAGALRELDFNSYWPKEYFTINIKDKKISYWKDGDSVAEVEYTRGHYHYHYYYKYNPIFKDHSAKVAFEKFPTNLGKELEGLVEDDYRNKIDEAFKGNKIDEAGRNLCILYNALAGHPGSYVVLGRANEKSEWKYYQPTDFPVYTMPADKDLIALASKHAANPDSISNATHLGQSIQAYVDRIQVKALSFDYRGGKIWYGDESAKAEKKDIPNLKLPYDFQTLNSVSACGWVVSNGNDKMENAKEYYSSRHFIDENTYNALNNLKWNELKVEPPTSKWIVAIKNILYYVGLFFFSIGVLLLYVAALPFVVKFLRKRSAKPATADADDANDNGNDGDDEKESHEDDKKILFEIVGGESTEELQEKIECLKEEVDRLKKEVKRKGNDSFSKETIEKAAVEEFKKSKEFKEYIADTQADAVSDFKKSKEHKECIADAEAEGERKFKESKQYKNLEIEAKNWRDLTSCTFEEKVITFLDNTHKMIPSFPKLNTLSNIYAEAKAAGKNETELVAVILAALDKQAGKTGLQTMYKELVANAEYGVDVRERFETCKALAQIYGERKEYKHIVSKGGDLTIWERLAVMLWATECTNELLKLFGKEHITAGVLAKAADIHKEDIMQVFATRIFKQHINDSTATVGALTASREKLMTEKLAEMQNKYNISMSESKIYKEFVAALDTIHDKLKTDKSM